MLHGSAREVRVYTEVEALGWQPRVTFEALLRIMEQQETEEGARPTKQPKTKTACHRRIALTFEDVIRGAF